LQANNEYLKNENERLTSALVSSREEIARLSALVGSAAVGGSASVGQAQPVSMDVALSGAPKGRSGYGY